MSKILYMPLFPIMVIRVVHFWVMVLLMTLGIPAEENENSSRWQKGRRWGPRTHPRPDTGLRQKTQKGGNGDPVPIPVQRCQVPDMLATYLVSCSCGLLSHPIRILGPANTCYWQNRTIDE